MTEEVNWGDPFSDDDEAARERARRRAEREARRAKRRGKLAEQVRETRAEKPAEPPVPEAPAGPAVAVPPTEAHPQPAAAPPGRPPRAVVHRRRLLALLGLVALAFVGLVIVVGANQLGGDDPAPAAPLKERKTSDTTIPEGYRISQIAEIAKKAGLRGNYQDAAKSAKGFDPAKYGAQNAKNLEGFLFPATYELFKREKAEELVTKQLDAFKDNIAGVDFGYAKSKNLTKYDVLTIASMVQAEAANTEEMPKIAQVIYNRLSQGTPLGIDATTRYATGNWTQPLSQSELASTSPYNTRVIAGLPPGPIGNPGLDAIEAAAKPAQGDLLYFVVKPGTCGHAFFETDAEFQEAADEYEAARQAAGGKSPDTC